MNPTGRNNRQEVEGEAGPSDIASADSNANITRARPNDSKGAIPKTKPAVKIKTGKKNIKFNNNVDESPPPRRSAMHEDILRMNGLSPDSSFDKGDMIIDDISGDIFSSISVANYNGDLSNCHISDEDDEDVLSISDDGCIYTYKGDQDADLPVSFFSLDMPVESPNPANRIQSSSPEMDFLEMDFDPGPYNEEFDNVESGKVDGKGSDGTKHDKSQNGEVKVSENKPSNNEIMDLKPVESGRNSKKMKKKDVRLSQSEDVKCENNDFLLDMPWTCSVSDRTRASSDITATSKYHCLKGDIVSPVDNPPKSAPLISALCDTPCIDCFRVENLENLDSNVMIWTEQEAYLKQTTQIAPSACGATAVLNVLNALKLSLPLEKVNSCINTRLRANSAPLKEYLLSRSAAGTTHTDIVDCLHKVTDGQVYARFFSMYPERIVNLSAWLGFWINKGAVPIATLNLQKCPTGPIPDAWHHQMIFGASPKGVYLCNPVECVTPETLWPQLCSESILLVRREDVLSRWNIKTDLPELMKIRNQRWRSMNVVGQVANLVYESRREVRLGFKNTSHIKIPAAYSSGVTLVMPANSSSCSLLRRCPQLPLLDISAYLSSKAK